MDCGCGCDGGGCGGEVLAELNPDALLPGWTPEFRSDAFGMASAACGKCAQAGPHQDRGGDVDFPEVWADQSFAELHLDIQGSGEACGNKQPGDVATLRWPEVSTGWPALGSERAEVGTWLGLDLGHGSEGRVSAPKPQRGDRVGSTPSPNGGRQADALNKIIQSLLEGLYDGKEEQFWRDLESIQRWESPSWITPNPLGPCGQIPLDECGSVPDRGRRHFTDVPVIEPGDLFYFDGSYTACEQDLIGHAWGLLLENADLLDWVVCVSEQMARRNGAAFQTQTPTECLRNAITGRGEGPPIEFAKRNETHCKMSAHRSNYRVSMCGARAEGSMFNVAADLYCRGDASQQRCAVFAIACSLIHEISHTACGYQHDDEEDEIVPCSIPYLIGSTVAWLLMERYPLIADDPCCEDYRNETTLGGAAPLPGFTTGCQG
jgi:hypothetical protein